MNGPKDQAGGCLADLLFYGVNIQIYALRNMYVKFFSRKFTQINSPQKVYIFLSDFVNLFDIFVDFLHQKTEVNYSNTNFILIGET